MSGTVRADHQPLGAGPGQSQQARDQVPAGLVVVGLALDRPAEPLVPLLTALSRWCTVTSLPAAAAGWIADAGGLARHRERLAGSPLALWLPDPELPDPEMWLPDPELRLPDPEPEPRDPSVRVILTPDLRGGRRAETPVLPIPVDGPGRDARFMPPVVRSRLRRARGLPEHPVLHWAPSGWHWPGLARPLPESLHATALGCAAAAVVTDAAALTLALSWGTPVVTSADAARELDATPGVHVLAGATPEERHRAAQRLASDPRLAAPLSWAGRLLWEQRHDVERAGTALAAALLPAGPRGHQLRLAELGAPSDAHICAQAASAVAMFPGAH